MGVCYSASCQQSYTQAEWVSYASIQLQFDHLLHIKNDDFDA